MNICINTQLKILIIFIFIILIAPLSKYFFDYYSLPNILTYCKDLLLCILFLAALDKTIFRDREKSLFLVLILWFTINYLTISLFDNVIYGLYYLRLYLLPLIAFFVFSSIINKIDDDLLQKLIRNIILLNVIVLLIAFVMYYIIINYPAIIALFSQGDDKLVGAFYISGANLLRLGFPQSGPNSLGIYFAVNIFFLLNIIIFPNKYTSRSGLIFLLILVNILALALTFSRSSFVLLFVCLLVTMIIAIANYHTIFVKFTKYLIGSLAIGILFAVLVNYVSDSALMDWIELNLTFSDPSMVGHKETFVELFDNFEKYFLIGYPRGTVGPKAETFSGEIINVENSYMVLIYDCGLYLFVVLLMAYTIIIRANISSKLQVPLLIGMLINISFLPTVYDVEIIIYVIIIFIILGKTKLLEWNNGNYYDSVING